MIITSFYRKTIVFFQQIKNNISIPKFQFSRAIILIFLKIKQIHIIPKY